MKKKIEEALSAEYKGLGLSEKTIGRLADYLLGSVEKEEDIVTAVKGDAVKLLATSIQGEIAGLQRAKETAETALADYKEKHPETTPPKPETEPEWAVKLREQNERILAKQEAEEKKAKQAATLASAIAAAKKSGCTDEKVLKLTEKLFALKDDESDEDAGKRFESEYNANVKEYFGGGFAPYHGIGISTPAKVSSEDKAARAREDAKRVREG